MCSWGKLKLPCENGNTNDGRDEKQNIYLCSWGKSKLLCGNGKKWQERWEIKYTSGVEGN